MNTNSEDQIAPAEVRVQYVKVEPIEVTLQRRSVVLSVYKGKNGKYIEKSCFNALRNKVLIYTNLRDMRSPSEFAELVAQTANKYSSWKHKGVNLIRQIRQALGGFEVANLKLSETTVKGWKPLLRATVIDLVNTQKQQVILVLDEMPYMLNNMSNAVATEVLDTLQSLRKTCPQMRMIFVEPIWAETATGVLGKHPANDDMLCCRYSATI